MANKKIGNEDIFEGNILVDIIAKATELEAKLKDQLKTFKDLAKNNPFKNGEDLKKFNDTMKEIDASASLLEQTQKNNKKATEELNKELAKEVAASKEIKDIIDDVNGTLNQNIKLQTQRKTQIQDLRKDQTELNKLYKIGAISQSKFTNESAKLSKEIQELSIANSKLGFTIKAQIKEGQAASTSFDQQAQRLGQLKSAYRKLTEEERENIEVGGVLLKSIESLVGRNEVFCIEYKDIGGKEFKPKNKALMAFCASLGNNDLQFRQTGMGYLIDKNNEKLSNAMLTGLSISFLIIAIIMAVLFKNPKMIIISLIPNVVPLLMIAAFMGFTGINLKVATSIIFTIAFGIAVDDSIHLLSRFKIELQRHKNPLRALYLSYTKTGKAVIVTSAILFSGFIALWFSSFASTFYLGLLVSMTLAFAVIADLTLIPILVLIFYRKEIKQHKYLG